jgi:hypothetical protein
MELIEKAPIHTKDKEEKPKPLPRPFPMFS